MNCQNERICLTPVLSTGFNTNNGLSGNYFDMSSTANVTITGFDVNVDAGSRTIEVWTRSGSYMGNTSSSAGWTQVGVVTVTGAGLDVPTVLPLDIGVHIPAGGTQAFGLFSNGGWNYTNGTAEGTLLATDGTISVFEGLGAGGPFGGTIATRNFSGNVYYRPAGVTTFAGGVSTFNGNMFDVSTSAGHSHIKGVTVNLDAGSHNVRVYAKRGTFAGSETTAADWTLLGSATGVTSQGPGNATPITFPTNLLVPGGETYGLYVTTEGTDINYTTGNNNYSFGNLNIVAGTGLLYPFSTPVAGRTWNGSMDNYESAELVTPLLGGNGSTGSMFDVVATNAVRVTGFQQAWLSTGAVTAEVYFKTGTHVGFETNAGAWTLLGSQAGIVPDGSLDLTPILIPIDVRIPAGARVAFYVTGTTGTVNYTNGTAVGNLLATDGNIDILEGVGKSYPFGATNTPRNFNGAIYYSDCR